MNEAPKPFPVFNALQSEFMPYKEVWQTPAHLKLDQTRLKYSAIFRRFQGASSVQATIIEPQREPVPMWIADMDVPPCSDILSAVTQNLRSTYGYQSLDIGEAVAKRYERSAPKHSRFRVEPVDVVDIASVIGAVDVALHTFCKPGQKVMVLTPTYSPLTESIKNNALQPVYIPLLQQQSFVESKVSELSATGQGENTLNCDADDIDTSVELGTLDKTATAFVICHPNNPTGTILSAKAQREIIDFCLHHNILLITDEVHSEFAFNTSNEPTIIPMFGAGVDEIANHGKRSKVKISGVTDNSVKSSAQESNTDQSNNIGAALPRIIHLNSVSKAFNLASIPGASYAIIKDKKTRTTFTQAINARHLSASNLGKVALIAAYEKGSIWLDTVKSALSFNRKLVVRFFEHYGIQADYTMGRAGYFLWLNLSSFPTQLKNTCSLHETSSTETARVLLNYSPVKSVEECIGRGVIGNDGTPFGSPHHIRLNLACHPSVIETALQRLCFTS